ncbi:ABC transporter permease [Paenibacillus sp.]|uniref:ABC transporter permease n=1 Tax=Paenibacillus sp. TaxID=58172 RepID=UPI0028AF119F|nr:ABC transporter permease [Paenibacillus sp.]
MTFRRMAYQIFKANLRRYLLFFLCSSFTIMIFFIFYSLYTNPDFNDPYQVNGMVSGNLYAPFLVMRVFAVLFILYAQMAFVKFRKSDYGLLMVLGMTSHNIRKIIIFENSMIAIASILIGLGAGTVFSGIFFFFVSKFVDIGDSAFTLTIDSYLHTIIFFAVIYIVVIAVNLLLTLRYNMVRLLKESKTAERSLIHGKIAGFIGVVLLGIAVYDMLSHYSYTNGNAMLRSIGISIVGVYFLMSGLGGWMQLILSRSTGSYYKHLLFTSDLNYTLGRSRIVLSLITFLVFITISLSSIIFFITWDSQKIAVKNNPYHIAYTEVFGKNSITPEALNEITDHGATPLISHQELEYIDLFDFKIFSDQGINSLTGSDYHVEKGHFLNLALVAQGEELKNQRPEMPTFEMQLSSGNQTLHSQGFVLKMVFNPVPILMNGLHIIVNKDDYAALKAEHMNAIGNLQLLNFKDWKKTGEIDAKLNAALAKYNKDNTESWYGDDRHDVSAFSTKSRINEYSQLQESGRFGIIIFTFVGLLFFIASGVVLHFSILTDLERAKIKFRKLNKIGITSKEAAQIVGKPFKVLFFLPYVLGTALATFYVVSSSRIEMSTALAPFAFCLLVGGAYLVFQVLFYNVYTKIYTRNMLTHIQLLEIPLPEEK